MSDPASSSSGGSGSSAPQGSCEGSDARRIHQSVRPETESVEKRGSRGRAHQPTRQQVEEHLKTHVPYRSWSEHCVRGKSKSPGHFRKSADDDDLVPKMSVDYMWMTSRKDEKGTTAEDADMENPETRRQDKPILVCRDSYTKWITAIPVKRKGDDEYTVKELQKELDNSGYKRLILKSDQENPRKSAIAEVKRNCHQDIVPEDSPVAESQSNGEVERAIQ